MELLGDILTKYLKTTALAGRMQLAEVETVWRAALGPAAGHTKLDSLKKGVAVFVVDSSVLLSELNNFRKLELLSHLQSAVHGVFIQDIKFRPGMVKPPARGQ